MPMVVPLIAGGLASVIVGGGLLGSLVGGLVAAGLSYLMAPKPSTPNLFGQDQARGVQQNISNPAGPLPVIYGKYRLAGTRVYIEVTGSENQYLWLVIAWCEGTIDAIEKLYFDELPEDDGRFSGLVDFWHHLGTDSQTVDTNLDAASSKWTSAHRGRGVAYSVVKLTYDRKRPDAWPQVPVVSAIVRGKKVVDVTAGGAAAYSNNPANCLYDYLTNTRYGLGFPSTDIDLASFQTAQAICDAIMTNAPEPAQATYTCDGVINIDGDPLENVRALLSS